MTAQAAFVRTTQLHAYKPSQRRARSRQETSSVPSLLFSYPTSLDLSAFPCNLSFPSRYAASAMPYCDRCDRSFQSRGAYQQHLDNSNDHHICDDCDKDFETAEALTQHYVQSPRHHFCQRCDEHFSDEDELDDHLEESHWRCQDCDKVRSN